MSKASMTPREADDFEPAFEHEQMRLAGKLLGGSFDASAGGKR